MAWYLIKLRGNFTLPYSLLMHCKK